MYQLKRILVCMDFSDIDEYAIRYASIVGKMMQSDTVYFLHVAKNLDLPKELEEKFRNVLAPVDETIKHQVKDAVNKYFTKEGDTETHIDVLEGTKPTEAIIKYAKRKDVDLIVLGKHSSKHKEGPKVASGKVAELSHCSVLLVSRNKEVKIDSVLVALDFSDFSALALEQAQKFREQNPSLKIYGLQVYNVPSGYHKTGKSYEEFAEIMKGHAQNDAKKFFKKHPELKEEWCEVHYQLNNNNRVDDELSKFAQEKKVDMIMIGSQGRTPAASFMLGSVAEHILHYHDNLPIFVVKEKNHNMSFLEALLKL
ncbi:MAG: universal stress protein [Cyclobacteriaceae bacterium]